MPIWKINYLYLLIVTIKFYLFLIVLEHCSFVIKSLHFCVWYNRRHIYRSGQGAHQYLNTSPVSRR